MRVESGIEQEYMQPSMAITHLLRQHSHSLQSASKPLPQPSRDLPKKRYQIWSVGGFIGDIVARLVLPLKDATEPPKNWTE